MRHDMFKVVVERPRAGSYGEPKGRRKEKVRSSIRQAVDWYFDPPVLKYEEYFSCCEECTGSTGDILLSMGRHEFETPSNKERMRPVGKGTGRKELTDNLNPLWGYLQGQVGRSWDDVYSDIRKRLSPRSTMHMHIVQHIKQQVRQETYLGDDGRVYEHGMWRRYGVSDPCLEEPVFYKNQFYVHPVTKKLCVIPTKRRKSKRKTQTKFQVSDLIQFRLIDDVWYVVEFERIPKSLGLKQPYLGLTKLYKPTLLELSMDYSMVKDFIFPRGLSNYKREEEYGYSNIHPVSRRPLGMREEKTLKKLMEDQRVEGSRAEQSR